MILALIVLFDFFVADQMCLSFYYHMYGSDIGSLEVYVLSSVGIRQSLFNKSSNQGNQWYFQKVYIPPYPDVQVCYIDWLIYLLCLMPLSAIFQLYHGDQF